MCRMLCPFASLALTIAVVSASSSGVQSIPILAFTFLLVAFSCAAFAS